MMFNINKFTTKSQEAIANAQQLAASAQNPEVTALHLLTALLQENDGIVEMLLEHLGVRKDQIRAIADEVENEVYRREEKEIPSSVIGEIVMEKLRNLDPVAYVRFASVYRDFKDVNTFMEELKLFLDN